MPKSPALKRVNNPLVLRALLDGNAPGELVGDESQEEWLADPLNVALRVKDDLGLFQHLEDGIYEAHCFCASRGKLALENTKAAISAMFDEYGAKAIYSEIPLEVPSPVHGKRTLLFARMAGFVPVRETQRPIGRVMFAVAKREHQMPSDCGIREYRSLTA